MFADLLAHAEHDLRIPCAGASVFPGPETSQAEVLRPTFMDDLAVPLVSPSAEGLLDSLAMTTSAIGAILAQMGLQLNLKKGKTEAVIKLRGPQAHRCLEGLACVDQEGQPASRLPLPQGGHLRVVPSYRHLGTIASASQTLGAEYGARAASANAATAALGPKLGLSSS